MGRNQNSKYTGKPLFPYMPPMVPQAAAPAPAPVPQPAAPTPPAAPLYNIVPVYNAPVRTVAQPLRHGQPTRRALLQRLENSEQ